VDDFAAYLVGAVDRLEAAHGIEFATIDPFNEPNTNYWSTWSRSMTSTTPRGAPPPSSGLTWPP
ncbi:hypothetical protein ACFCV6_24245, partial [Streptomyces virginiae]|uniref:hypothetical protein n=1 Tax=Streptomyces virginiae TaxID=1961 RepID=UPI0035E31E63